MKWAANTGETSELTEPRPLLSRRLLFFGGKGGVGKTTLAAAYALLSAQRGSRTLLVSTDPAHSTADVLGTSVGSEATEVADRLYAIEIDPLEEADAYIAEVKDRLAHTIPPRLTREVERQIDIARVSPGAAESALFDRFTRIMEADESRFDRIIFDTAPTGHTLRLITLPESMTVWMSGLIAQRRKTNVLGRMWRNVAGAAAGSRDHAPDPVIAALEERRHRFEHARRRIGDADRSAFVFVLVPERLPILETERAAATLGRHRIPIGAIIVNRVLPADADGEFLERRRVREAQYLDHIAGSFAGQHCFHVPLLESDVTGLPALERIIERLPAPERMAPN
jgi:arsenite/tail-anchored protein-transporting ATPase